MKLSICRPIVSVLAWIVGVFPAQGQKAVAGAGKHIRERVSINEGWKFYHYPAAAVSDSLMYDVRPEVTEANDDKPADSRPTDAVAVTVTRTVLKPWIMPTGNEFIKDPTKRYVRPAGDPAAAFPFVAAGFDDQSWETVNLPHDWAIRGPFYTEGNAIVGGGMGRLPIQGVAWYRRKITIAASDAGKEIFLEVDGAMSYAMVWLNGHLVGGWPYGYSSWQLNLTPYLIPGATNQLAIRIDNPLNSSRWYPGAGIYRNVWLTRTNAVHVAHWGTAISTTGVSKAKATVHIKIQADNTTAASGSFDISTECYALNSYGHRAGRPVATLTLAKVVIQAGASRAVDGSVTIESPQMWGPAPEQVPHMYTAITTIRRGHLVIDRYQTSFGIRDLRFDADKGLFVNGQHITLKGVNQHHDLGALGAAFNLRAAERQLLLLKQMGCNAIRMSHNPPAPELLDLTDRLGFLVIDEVFDCWERKKTPLDFHLIFPEWHEQDLRSMIRRDRNHPSIMLWSFGNEVGEQYTDEKGAALARELYAIVKEEDSTRPTTTAMNYAKPGMPLPAVPDVIGLNYQGEGIRNGGAYAGLKGINTPPLFPAFHQQYPAKMILSSENASALSSRGEYQFPVHAGNSAPVRDGKGGDSKTQQVSAYELYSVDFGSSADKVFATTDQHPFVAGGFVWTGWDYLGEPTPYYQSRSSYCGIIDLAGFKKDRFYLYQAYWRPDFAMAHILPHWNWPERRGEITPVHVFTSGDEAELFLDGQSLGRRKKAPFEYRLRWDSVKYSPGTLRVVAYKAGKKWAEDEVKTTGTAGRLALSADKASLMADGNDLIFVTVSVTDNQGLTVPNAKNLLRFSVEGPGEIVATDNGDAASLVSFASLTREAFNGFCLLIIQAKTDQAGTISITVESAGLTRGTLSLPIKK